MSISEEEERGHREWMRSAKELVDEFERGTYKREHGELILWYAEELHKIEKLLELSYGLDGEHSMKMRELHDLYHNKENELKKKYGIED